MYEKLLKEAAQHGLDILELKMAPKVKGLYGDRTIWINKTIQSFAEKSIIMAEELGHYHTSSGDILDQTTIKNRKQEKQARSWAYEKLTPLYKIVQAYENGISNRYELADFLGVTENFIEFALKHYQEKYGMSTMVGDYAIWFEPLYVTKTENLERG